MEGLTLPQSRQGEVDLQRDHVTGACSIRGSGKVSCWRQAQGFLQYPCLSCVCVCMCVYVCEQGLSSASLYCRSEGIHCPALDGKEKGARVCSSALPPLTDKGLACRGCPRLLLTVLGVPVWTGEGVRHPEELVAPHSLLFQFLLLTAALFLHLSQLTSFKLLVRKRVY